MKKILALALAVATMVTTATVSFASAEKKVSPENALKPKMWVEYNKKLSSGKEQYFVYFDLGEIDASKEWKKIEDEESGESYYEGLAICNVGLEIEADTDLFDVTTSSCGAGDLTDSSQEYNSYAGIWSLVYSPTSISGYVGSRKGIAMRLNLVPKNPATFDPNAVKLNIKKATIVVDEEQAGVQTYLTSYSTASNADYPIDATFGSEVMETLDNELYTEGNKVVASTVKVTNATAATRVVVTYEPTSESKTFGSSLADLLGIEGSGTYNGNVRFAVEFNPEEYEANGFVFNVVQ